MIHFRDFKCYRHTHTQTNALTQNTCTIVIIDIVFKSNLNLKWLHERYLQDSPSVCIHRLRKLWNWSCFKSKHNSHLNTFLKVSIYLWERILKVYEQYLQDSLSVCFHRIGMLCNWSCFKRKHNSYLNTMSWRWSVTVYVLILLWHT